MNWRATLAGVMLTTAATASFTMAQAPGGGGAPGAGGQGGGGGGRQGGGNFDPAQMQTRMMERMKEQLKATDEEWKVIEPKLAKVMTDQRDLRAGGGGGGRRGGGGGGGGGNNPESTTELGTALTALRTALESESTSADDIGNKLSALRAAREKATANLETSRKALKEVLTARQEAQLVLNGALE